MVATPIGNLQDISLRALEILKSANIIACEDTRHTGKLLKHFDISGKLVSYHEHNESVRTEEFIKLVETGKSIAVVSDAGTPGIADPGYRLVKRALELGIKVNPVPGASAFISAVTVSGLPTDSIFFGGFLPSKKGERIKRLREISQIPATLCFYETPHRIAASLADCAQVLGNRKAAVIRELTKLHEETVCGDLVDLAKQFGGNATKGEIVIIIDRESPDAVKPMNLSSLVERLVELEIDGLDQKKALKQAAKEFGVSRSEAYRQVQAEKDF